MNIHWQDLRAIPNNVLHSLEAKQWNLSDDNKAFWWAGSCVASRLETGFENAIIVDIELFVDITSAFFFSAKYISGATH